MRKILPTSKYTMCMSGPTIVSRLLTIKIIRLGGQTYSFIPIIMALNTMQMDSSPFGVTKKEVKAIMNTLSR